jgi:hypothetical protein
MKLFTIATLVAALFFSIPAASEKLLYDITDLAEMFPQVTAVLVTPDRREAIIFVTEPIEKFAKHPIYYCEVMGRPSAIHIYQKVDGILKNTTSVFCKEPPP